MFFFSGQDPFNQYTQTTTCLGLPSWNTYLDCANTTVLASSPRHGDVGGRKNKPDDDSVTWFGDTMSQGDVSFVAFRSAGTAWRWCEKELVFTNHLKATCFSNLPVVVLGLSDGLSSQTNRGSFSPGFLDIVTTYTRTFTARSATWWLLQIEKWQVVTCGGSARVLLNGLLSDFTCHSHCLFSCSLNQYTVIYVALLVSSPQI